MKDCLLRLDYCAKSHVGFKRKRNEDYFIVMRKGFEHNIKSLGSLFLIADGIGGHPGGHIASRLACEVVKSVYFTPPKLWERMLFSITPLFLKIRLKKAFEIAQDALSRYEKVCSKCAGLGTTLSALLVLKKVGIIAHVGDTRIYKFRNNELFQLTVDDTFFQELTITKKLDYKNSKINSYRHLLTQAIGAGGYTTIHMSIVNVQSHDIFLLSTDGLHDYVPQSVIKNVLMSAEITQICSKLIDIALSYGGKDNITAVAVRC